MRILNTGTGQPLDRVTVYLTPAEAVELRRYLEDLSSGVAEHHVHLSDGDYEREITIAVYTPENLGDFDDRSKRLIIEGT